MTNINKIAYKVPESAMGVMKEVSATAIRLNKRREQIDRQYKSDFAALHAELQAAEMKARNAICNALGIEQLEGHAYIIDDAYFENFGIAFLWDAWGSEALPEPTVKPVSTKLN